ncbi:MAG: hypothetical protein VYA84_04245 [Planctomycetota bacterium]|nr:hypothetical protein [Planctomycetota bacterium]
MLKRRASSNQLATNLVSSNVILGVNSIIKVSGLVADHTIDVVRTLKIVANFYPAETVATHHADPTLQARTSGSVPPPFP